jgi:hypothetical protein
MRVSIWRQFSSNHSANFTIVARFPTPEQAQQVADQIRADLETVNDFWNSLNEEDRLEWQQAVFLKGRITPPELLLREKYGVWATTKQGEPVGLDWLYVNDRNLVSDVIHVYRGLIFMSNPIETTNGKEPFDAILQQLGGQIAYELEIGRSTLEWFIAFDLPDEAQVQAFMQRIRDLMNGNFSLAIPGTYILDENDVQIRQQGAHIEMRNFLLRIPEHEGFAALMSFLHEQGATHIEYSHIGEES